MAQPKQPGTLEEPDDRRVGRPSSRPVSPLPPWRHRGQEKLQRQSTPEREGPSKFPRVFHLFQPHGFGKTYRLAEREDCPLFAVSVHKGWFDRPNLELHSGPDKKDAPLAAVRHESDGFSVILPLPTSRPVGKEAEGAEPNEVIRTERHAGKTYGGTYRFCVKVSKGWARPQETFEWRHGEGDAWDTWKLVRMGVGLSLSQQGKGDRTGDDDGSDTDDEEEIVSVWTIEKTGSEETGKFEFVNSATLGRLGERFATLAVMTALGIWNDGKRDGPSRDAT